MSTNTDTNKYTIFFAIAMVVVVGSLLAFTASSLKPNIQENERMEKQQNILYAMGINENGATDIKFIGTDKVAGEFSKYISVTQTDVLKSRGLYSLEPNKNDMDSKLSNMFKKLSEDDRKMIYGLTESLSKK